MGCTTVLQCRQSQGGIGGPPLHHLSLHFRGPGDHKYRLLVAGQGADSLNTACISRFTGTPAAPAAPGGERSVAKQGKGSGE